MTLNHKIGLGTAQFGMNYGVSNSLGQTTSTEVAKILDSAFKFGIRMIDTASAYGNAHAVLGENQMNRFQIVSKFMPPSGGISIETQLEQCLNRLRVDSLYGYLAHRPSELVQDKSSWKKLLDLKDVGKIRKIGFSLNVPSELEMLLLNNIQPDIIQVPYNYFDNRFYEQMIKLKSSGCEIHCRSAFLQGLFFLDADRLSSFFDSAKETVRYLQTEFKEDLPKVLLKYVASLDFVDSVIIGVESEYQLTENLNGLDSAKQIDPMHLTISEAILTPSAWPKNE